MYNYHNLHAFWFAFLVILYYYCTLKKHNADKTINLTNVRRKIWGKQRTIRFICSQLPFLLPLCVTENSGSLPKTLLSWAFSRFRSDQNSLKDGSLQLWLCFQDVSQALYLASFGFSSLPCACFVSFEDKELSIQAFLCLKANFHINYFKSNSTLYLQCCISIGEEDEIEAVRGFRQ